MRRLLIGTVLLSSVSAAANPAISSAGPQSQVHHIQFEQDQLEQRLKTLSESVYFLEAGVCQRDDRKALADRISSEIRELVNRYNMLTSRAVSGDIVLLEYNGCPANFSKRFNRTARETEREIELLSAAVLQIETSRSNVH